MANNAPKPPTYLFQGLSLEDSSQQWSSLQTEVKPMKKVGNNSSGAVFQFGAGHQTASPSTSQVETFAFTPGDALSRTTSQPQAAQLQSPFTFGITPPAQTTCPTIEDHTAAPPFSWLSPSTPNSNRRSPSIFSSPSTLNSNREPAPTFSSTPTSVFAASPTPEPPAPTTAYDAAAEAALPHPLFSATFQSALKQGPEIAQEATKALEKMQIGVKDAEVSKFLADAKALQRFQGTDTRTIAVLGDSGEGKSSLINSLLHFPGVAQTSDIGSACTSVVTEYRQKKTEHGAPITIEVEYLSAFEIRDLIKELLWSYRQLFLPSVESEETSEQDYNRFMRESEQAWSALHAAFKHKRQFTQTFAQDMSDGALERITEQLVQWAREIEWPTGGGEGFWRSTAQTADECVEKTKLFMQDRFWPFTKIIRVYLDSPVLKTGVVLSDLPGLQDTNLARVRATQDYLIKCDTIVIVAKISRAITDQSLKSSLFYVLSRHVPMEWEQSGTQRLNVSVVCTKSEEINLRNARLEFCGPNKSIPLETMTKLDNEIDAAKASGDRTRKKTAKKQQELLLVEARNNHVRQNLRNVYSSEMDGRMLDVFCVSNKWYEKYCPKGNTKFVEASGVPDLRRFCHTVTADAQFNEAKHFLKSRLSALLNTLDLWADSSLRKKDIEQPDESIRTKVKELMENIPKLVDTFELDFTTCFQEQIMIFFGRRDPYWDQAASKEGRAWTSWHWSKTPASSLIRNPNDFTAQYNAWCLNNGDHQTLKRGHENWNAKIIWKMRMELEGQWDLVEEEVSDVFTQLLEATKKRLDSLKSSLRDTLPQRLADPIVQSVAVQVGNLEYRMSREQRQFHSEVRTIRRCASDTNYNSYILQDMIPVYRSAAGEWGSGKAARQRSTVQGHIEQGVIFPKMGIAMSESMNKLIRTTSQNLKIMLRSILDTVSSDLDIVFQSSRVARDETRDSKIGDFATKIKGLKERHERLLQTVEGI
ncbi:uncharacterized protein B0J16DRAFT_395906 [Fusarium flagelliforme]|uniref:uncharacterized protein n=1 Tax=Fusarium flagelliforme TaxID=2675880 RepID=UPI001E8DA7C5|nr:uncharacterized protein B0J16DRAFT_395906 [Fusarium flagelliforme]KAH7193897.1 hypothetical protein B0J16DRAFT_395906 [Fusarium flagelliforme]